MISLEGIKELPPQADGAAELLEVRIRQEHDVGDRLNVVID